MIGAQLLLVAVGFLRGAVRFVQIDGAVERMTRGGLRPPRGRGWLRGVLPDALLFRTQLREPSCWGGYNQV